MTIFDDNAELLEKKLSEMAPGSEAGLAEIFGDEWPLIGTAGQKKQFGRLFKAAVKARRYPEIEWVRIENSGRFDVYRKK